MVKNFFVIDSHCHIYPEKIAERAVAGTSNFYSQVFACKGTVSDLAVEAKKAGIDFMIVQSVATTPKQVKSINEFIASEVANSGGKMLGLGTLHPDSQDIAGDIAHLKELGLKGVKLHPDIQAFKLDDYRCLKIYELMEKEGLVLLLHTGDSRYDYSNPNRLLPILETYTNLKVIGAHFGGYSIWDEAIKVLPKHENFYVDCSSSFPFIKDKAKAVELIKAYGEDRVLFGTDYPMWSPKEEMNYFLSLDLTDEAKEKILSLNAKKLFNIK